MTTVLKLAASMPKSPAYVHLVRRGVGYTGGPYPTPEAASQSAARLFRDVPDTTAVTVVRRPRVAPITGGRRWYARAVYRADGYTSAAGPFRSRREARAHLEEVAGRGEIGTLDEWAIDYCYVDRPIPCAGPATPP